MKFLWRGEKDVRNKSGSSDKTGINGNKKTCCTEKEEINKNSTIEVVIESC